MRRLPLWLAGLLLVAVLPMQVSAQTAPPPHVTILAAGTDQILAATQCGVYRLPSGGGQWEKIPGLDQQPDQLVTLQDNTIFVNSGGLYRLRPGGVWEIATEPSSGISGALAVNPLGTRLYVGGESIAGARIATVFRSDDAGQTWQQLSPPTGERVIELAVAVDPASGQDVIGALVAESGRSGGVITLQRSLDGGATWTRIEPTISSTTAFSFHTLVVDRSNTAFYAAGYTPNTSLSHLYRLPATGALEEIALPDEARQSIRDVEQFQETLVIATGTGLFYRHGSGPFQRFEAGLNGAIVNDLLVRFVPIGGVAVYAGTSAGVFIGYPGVSNGWQNISTGLQACPQTTPSPYDRIPAFEDTPTRRYFAETGHSLSYGFKSFWERNGSLPVFGFPLSEEFIEHNVDLDQDFTTQYFERERFEYHPDNPEAYRVLLGRLGDELLRAQGRDWRNEAGTTNPFPGTACQSFAVGGQQRTVCGPFLSYWRTHGLEFDGRGGTSYNESLALFGLPLTAPKIERNADGDEVMTQWFERARFEYHPNNPQAYRVLLGRLGSEVLRARGVPVP